MNEIVAAVFRKLS